MVAEMRSLRLMTVFGLETWILFWREQKRGDKSMYFKWVLNERCVHASTKLGKLSESWHFSFNLLPT
jgi:hypothetical protein